MMFSWLALPATPLLIGHRGASRLAPENTFAAYRRAVNDGARAVELDVRLSRDREVMVIHDAGLRRTTDGHGSVRKTTLAELRSLTAGGWFAQEFTEERIPTLDEVLTRLPPRIGINVELKIDRDRAAIKALVDRCHELLARHRMVQRVMLSSFSSCALRYAASAYPDFIIGILTRPFSYRSSVPKLLARTLGARFLVCHARTIRPALVDEAHTHGLAVIVYTVNSVATLRRVVRCGVDGVMSDDPSLLVPQL